MARAQPTNRLVGLFEKHFKYLNDSFLTLFHTPAREILSL